MNASIKIFKKDGLLVISNLFDHSINNKNIFDKIEEHAPHTLVINNLDGNALYYYITKKNFPTVKNVIYFGDYSPQDVDGLYEFEKTLVTNYNKYFAGDNFVYMTPDEKKYYQNIVDKLKLNEEKNKSLSIVSTENATDYFRYIQIEPTFEVIEE